MCSTGYDFIELDDGFFSTLGNVVCCAFEVVLGVVANFVCAYLFCPKSDLFGRAWSIACFVYWVVCCGSCCWFHFDYVGLCRICSGSGSANLCGIRRAVLNLFALFGAVYALAILVC